MDSNSRMNDLMVVGCKSHLDDLAILNEKRLCVSISEGGQTIEVGVLRGPDFGNKFKQTRTISLDGLTAQKIEVIEEFNIILVACFDEEDPESD